MLRAACDATHGVDRRANKIRRNRTERRTRSVHVKPPLHRRERIELCALFCLQAHAIALWYVPFSSVLKAHGYERLVPFAFACSSIAALISPMWSGALADQRFGPERILRWLAVCVAATLTLTFLAIERGWAASTVLALIFLQQLCYSPTWGLATTIVLARLQSPEREFGPVRAYRSTLSGFLGAAAWLGVAAFTLRLPSAPPRRRKVKRRWQEALGWDALGLLRDPNHRAVFVTAALFSIPVAAFYPFGALHLQDLGETRVSAALSLGQVTELIGMFALAPLLARVRLKSLFLAGIAFGVARYGLFALNTRPALLAGILLHGFCFTLFFIPAQIYAEKRIDPAFRARAQALLTVMMSGIGSLAGYLSCGWWRDWCENAQGRTDWPLYWAALAAVVLAVLVYFALTYRSSAHLHSADESAGSLPGSAEPLLAPTPE